MLEPETFVELSKLGALSPEGLCKTFDAKANGFGRGEGCGMVVLKRLEDAKRDSNRILAVIRGSACNEDGASANLTAPNGFAQEKLMRQALTNGSLSPSDVSFVEAHGTGTSLGDPIEIRALGNVYGENRTPENPLYIASAKANINHLEAAAGVAGVIKLVLSLMHRQIPPHIGMKTINPLIQLEKIPALIPMALTKWPGKNPIGAVSSFGFSGINAHLIIEGYFPVQKSAIADRPLHLLLISAKNKNALIQLANHYVEYLAKHSEISFADVCNSAMTGRSHFEYRLAILANDHQEGIKKLQEFLTNAICVPCVPESISDFKFDEMREKYTGKNETEWRQILELLADKYLKGDKIDWKGFDQPYSRQSVEIPLYPFQHKRFWAKILDGNKGIVPSSEQLLQILNTISENKLSTEEVFQYFIEGKND